MQSVITLINNTRKSNRVLFWILALPGLLLLFFSSLWQFQAGMLTALLCLTVPCLWQSVDDYLTLTRLHRSGLTRELQTTPLSPWELACGLSLSGARLALPLIILTLCMAPNLYSLAWALAVTAYLVYSGGLVSAMLLNPDPSEVLFAGWFPTVMAPCMVFGPAFLVVLIGCMLITTPVNLALAAEGLEPLAGPRY